MAATKKVKEPTLKKLTVKSTAASKKGEKPTETKSKVTRGRKKKESTPSPEPDEREEGDGASESDDIDVDWTPDLTWKLVNSIMDDGVIKQGLFPAPKGNQSISKGGSKSKTDHYWALAEHIFTGDPTYGGVFSRTRTESADQKTWGRKIKNRLQRIIRDTRGFMGEMGQTGMGIMKATELDMSLENHLTNCWSRIRDKHPWFWTIKSIISERPNIVHTGVGNADDGFDMSYLGGEPSSDGPSGVENDRAAYESEDWQSIGDAEMPECNNGVQSDASIPTEVLGKGKKRKQDDLDSIGNVKKVSVDSVADNKKSKGPRASRSTSATPATSAKKAKPMSGVERFNDLAVREEETTQKALDLRKTKAMNERDKGNLSSSFSSRYKWRKWGKVTLNKIPSTPSHQTPQVETVVTVMALEVLTLGAVH
ncbi:hypothetical protein HYPSUDRAFT_205980 [Hypholoma sublateritium FD-334 SS-4]|uniref:No apical meristem-associated C-terminal domain-containing protein n=1 Tax=Hypholoma sublateritium (strain FD-334 SS-4) TaxID=945553 RepID=A0A0D2NM60_HYPSF|nr:hypothetical protein HYPSUDRAFT_205980 [Hypholoma sublateritium FD-334 SS-4]